MSTVGDLLPDAPDEYKDIKIADLKLKTTPRDKKNFPATNTVSSTHILQLSCIPTAPPRFHFNWNLLGSSLLAEVQRVRSLCQEEGR